MSLTIIQLKQQRQETNKITNLREEYQSLVKRLQSPSVAHYQPTNSLEEERPSSLQGRVDEIEKNMSLARDWLEYFKATVEKLKKMSHKAKRLNEDQSEHLPEAWKNRLLEVRRNANDCLSRTDGLCRSLSDRLVHLKRRHETALAELREVPREEDSP